MKTQIDQSLFLLASQYRQFLIKTDGVVIFYNGEIQGWCNELRNPESWCPGCIAVSLDQQFIAIGGNGYDGAEKWQLIESGDSARHPANVAALAVETESHLPKAGQGGNHEQTDFSPPHGA